MSKRIPAAVFLAAACIGVVGPVVGRPNPPAHGAGLTRTFQVLYDRANAAMERRDVDGMLADIDPSFESTSPTGEIHDFAFAVSNSRRIADDAHSISATSRIRSVKVSGNRADVVVFSKLIIVYEQPGNHKKVTDIVTDLCRDTWVNKGHRWKMVKSVDLKAT